MAELAHAFVIIAEIWAGIMVAMMLIAVAFMAYMERRK